MIDHDEKYQLKLYIAGRTPMAMRAIRNIEKIAEENFAGTYKIEVIDLLEHPRLVEEEMIFATPTLVKQLPLPMRKIIGDLSNEHEVLVGLDIIPRDHSKT